MRGVPASQSASRRCPSVGEREAELRDRILVFPHQLAGEVDGEALGVGIRAPLPEQPVALVGDARVLRASVPIEAQGEAHGIRSVKGLERHGVLDREATEGVLGERDPEPTCDHPPSLAAREATEPVSLPG